MVLGFVSLPPHKGGGIDKGVPRRRFALQGTSRGITEDTLAIEDTPLPKNFRAFCAILLLFLPRFGKICNVFTSETIVLVLVFHFFRACGAFLLQNISFYKRFVPVNEI